MCIRDSSIEVYIDDTLQFAIPHGGKRDDVGDAFPEIIDAGNSGYASAVNFNALGGGEHDLLVRVVDGFGSIVERTVNFEVTRFDSGFIQKGDMFELGWARATGLGDTLIIRQAAIDGNLYNITLKWRTSSQGFEIVNIVKQ